MSRSIQPLEQLIREWPAFRAAGRVVAVRGALVETSLPASPGTVCVVRTSTGWETGEIIGFKERTGYLLTYAEKPDIALGNPVVDTGRFLSAPAGSGVLGRILDGVGRPLDGAGPLRDVEYRPLFQEAPNPVRRRPVDTVLVTGVRAIDALLPLGVGQRVGIFAGSGVGKTTLLSMIARNCTADVVVLCLVGERGRELRETLEACRASKVERIATVVATADKSPLLRVRAAFTAISIAEHFRDKGQSVVLLLDSITRLAMAQREIGLLLGEPPTTRGYTPSVFQLLTSLLERLGNTDGGSITGILTVLVEGDDINDPIADATRAILDGHILLDRSLAERAQYPPVDVLRSVSRTADKVMTTEHRAAARAVREILSVYRDAEDLLQIGAYRKGANPTLDRALELMPAVRAFLSQAPDERADYSRTIAALQAIAARWRAPGS